MSRTFFIGVIAVVLVALSAAQQQSQTPEAPAGSQPTGTPPPVPGPAIEAQNAGHKRKHRKKKRTGPKKVVVSNGSTGEAGGQLSPGLSDSEAQHQRRTTEQLLRDSEANLKTAASRQLSDEQQDTARQITTYMQQAHSASDEGDLERAHNLALKARLLSETLVRR